MEVRYLGLVTPETHHPEKPVEYFNLKASGFNKELETEARQNCRGPWQTYCEGPPVFSATEIEDKMDEYLGEVVTVRYRVIGTYDSRDIISLNPGMVTILISSPLPLQQGCPDLRAVQSTSHLY